MAATFFHKPTQRWLTSIYNGKEGDVVLLSWASFAYSSPMGGFGFRGSEFTQYTLAAPVAYDESFGRRDPLFDLDECDPRNPFDKSPQRGREGAYDYRYRDQVQKPAVEAIAELAAALVAA